MSPTERQLREQADVKERILAAARDLFVEHGYEAVSLRKIASAIGYTAPALYTHFPDKTELLAELCRRDFAILAAGFIRLGRIEDPIERVYRIGLAYIRFAREHPNHYRLMFMAPHPKDLSPSEEDLAAMRDPDQDAYAFLLKAVNEAMAAGRFRPEYSDAELVAQTLWAGVHGVASLEVTHGDCPWADWRGLDRRAKTMCGAMLRGLVRNPAELDEVA